ncbi:MAG: tRNA modification GTPase [Deltaproteobacteria bacterium]|nr:tRNA modification GTPase [Deltaproteobacteria bacterium]
MKASDTIVAPATAPGPAAVGIVRLSGSEAFSIGRMLCARWPERLEPRKAFFARFVREGDAFDSGLVLPFPGPASYTGEDVLELHGHGGRATQELLAAALACGARLAEPGEFTQRAFVNGKLDLVQAESVAQLIAAQSGRALRVAARGLGGSLSEKLDQLEDAVLDLQGRVEGLLDFPAEAEGAEAGLVEAMSMVAGELEALASTFAQGRRLFVRSEVVLAGPVNAGKSSLLNALVGEERALVDALPGTTRDLVTADCERGGLPLRLVDTAGWREASGVEARGIAVGQAAAERADLVLWVTPIDALEPPPDAGWLHLASKRDLDPARKISDEVIAISARTGAGLDTLWEAVSRRLGAGSEDALVVGVERQALGLGEASAAIRRAAEQGALELVAEELGRARSWLASVRGRALEGDALDRVFRQFCIGK